MTSHQQISLGFLFPYVKPEGIYVCEDLHTSYNQDYIDTKETTMMILERFEKTKEMSCDRMTEKEMIYLMKYVREMYMYERKENAIACWRCKNRNYFDKESCLYCQTDLSANDKSITCVLIHK